MFAVVQFEDEKVSYVPVSWIFENDTKCYWPKKKNNNFRDIMKQPEENWLIYSIRKFFGYAGEPQFCNTILQLKLFIFWCF